MISTAVGPIKKMSPSASIKNFLSNGLQHVGLVHGHQSRDKQNNDESAALIRNFNCLCIATALSKLW